MRLVIESALKRNITQFMVAVMHQVHRMHEFFIEYQLFGGKPKKFVRFSAELSRGVANIPGQFIY